MDGYPFAHDVRVRFAETDAQGIAHHAAFVVWLEEARVAYLDAYVGGYAHIRERGLEALTTSVHLDYHRSAEFHDVLRIWTRCTDLRGARFRYEYRVEREGELVAEGYTTHATIDRATHRPTRVPAWLADAISAAEQDQASAT
jgi:acyl-CoA thioester hydrolase